MSIHISGSGNIAGSHGEDIRIAGSSTIAGGSYGIIRAAGSTSLDGSVICRELHCAGSLYGGALDCAGDLKVSGSAYLDGDLRSGNVKVSGSCHVDGSCFVKGELAFAGSSHVSGGIEAELVRFGGRLFCGGLLNAETILIESDNSHNRSSQVGSIGCGSITVRHKIVSGIFGKLRGIKQRQILEVTEGIEGDEVDLEYTTAGSVTCRRAVIGPGCVIGTLCYSESAEISPDAEVKTVKKAE